MCKSPTFRSEYFFFTNPKAASTIGFMLINLFATLAAFAQIQVHSTKLNEKALAAAGPQAMVYAAPAVGEALLWVTAGVGFAPAEMPAADLAGYGPSDGRPYVWHTVKLWPDGSIKLAHLKTPVGFGAALQLITLEPGHQPYATFKMHRAISQALFGKILQIKFQAKMDGLPIECKASVGSMRFMRIDASEWVARWRSHCYKQEDQTPLTPSITTFGRLTSESAVVEATVVIGNDTLEDAKRGFLISEMVLVPPEGLPMPKLKHPSSHGNLSASLSDGQTMALRYVMSLSPEFDSTASMLEKGTPQGFQSWPSMKASGAFMTAQLPATKIPLEDLINAHNQIDASTSFPNANPRDYLGYINLNPGSTGDQPDFAATMPSELIKACQGYSAKLVSRISLAAFRESFRPSFFWQTKFVSEERVSNLDYPELFFWGSRPHFDFNWNTQYPIWKSRTQQAGFFPGSTGGWNAYDNQHASMNYLRGLYELTGDAYLEDVLRGYVSELYWMMFTDWMTHTEAERTARLIKEAIALVELFPDMPESKALAARLPQKLQVYKNDTSITFNKYGVPALGLFNACDPRVNNGIWCPKQPAGENIAVVAWQTGFRMELEAMNPNPDLRYLDAVDQYFLPDGTPKTYFLSNDPSDYILGGIGIQWWAGWVVMALKHPEHPNSQFLIEKLKPKIEAQLGSGYFSPIQGWTAW